MAKEKLYMFWGWMLPNITYKRSDPDSPSQKQGWRVRRHSKTVS